MTPFLITALLALAPTTAAPRSPQELERVQEPRPDPVLQDRLRALLAADTAEEQARLLEALRTGAGAGNAHLVQQLLLFSEASRSTREAMLFGFVRARLPLANEEIVNALVPLLEGAHAPRRASIAGVLSEFEDLSAERGVDFTIYRPTLEREAPEGLVRHLFDTDADAALLVLLRARVRDPAETRALLWAWHVLADLRWKLRFGFLAPEDLAHPDPEVLRSLDTLAHSPRPWARLAAARIALEQPGLGSAAGIERLAQDENALVRETAREVLEGR